MFDSYVEIDSNVLLEKIKKTREGVRQHRDKLIGVWIQNRQEEWNIKRNKWYNRLFAKIFGWKDVMPTDKEFLTMPMDPFDNRRWDLLIALERGSSNLRVCDQLSRLCMAGPKVIVSSNDYSTLW